MAKKFTKKLANKIPDWFSLANYARAKHFGPLDWGHNLWIRADLRRAGPNDEDTREVRELVHQYGAVPADVLRKKYSKIHLTEWYYGGDEGVLVYGLPIREAYAIYEFFNDEYQFVHDMLYFKEISSPYRTEPLTREELAIKEWRDTFVMKAEYDKHFCKYGDSIAHLSVELEAPDDLLIEGFKAWLSNARKEKKDKQYLARPSREKINERRFDAWCKYAVLPYLDLKIHELEIGIKYELHEIGDAIYPEEGVIFDTTESVRKTTAKYATQALAAVDVLITQGVAEENIKKRWKK